MFLPLRAVVRLLRSHQPFRLTLLLPIERIVQHFGLKIWELVYRFPDRISILIIQHVRVIATLAHPARADFVVSSSRIKRSQAVIHVQTKFQIFIRHVGQDRDLFLHFRGRIVFAQIQIQVADFPGSTVRSVEVTLDSSENHIGKWRVFVFQTRMQAKPRGVKCACRCIANQGDF